MITLNLKPAISRDYLESAHKRCVFNRADLEVSKTCGCFYCLEVYSPKEITKWTDDNQTAICAKCPVDSVLAEASGFPLTSEFLERMHEHYF